MCSGAAAEPGPARLPRAAVRQPARWTRTLEFDGERRSQCCWRRTAEDDFKDLLAGVQRRLDGRNARAFLVAGAERACLGNIGLEMPNSTLAISRRHAAERRRHCVISSEPGCRGPRLSGSAGR